MILFVIALAQELKIIKEIIKKLKIFGVKIDFLLSGVGNLNVVYNVKNYISKYEKPIFIVNIGVCGKINNDYNDFFQIYRIKNISNNREIICPVYINHLELDSIACSDKIITNKNELIEEKFVDMESFGIDFVCDKEKIPYILIKKPFDVIGEKSKKVDIIDLENTLKGFNYKKLIDDIKVFTEKNSPKFDFGNDILYLQNKHRLTFSETEFLKKYINKEIAFGNLDILNDLKIKSKNETLELIIPNKI